MSLADLALVDLQEVSQTNDVSGFGTTDLTLESEILLCYVLFQVRVRVERGAVAEMKRTVLWGDETAVLNAKFDLIRALERAEKATHSKRQLQEQQQRNKYFFVDGKQHNVRIFITYIVCTIIHFAYSYLLL